MANRVSLLVKLSYLVALSAPKSEQPYFATKDETEGELLRCGAEKHCWSDLSEKLDMKGVSMYQAMEDN